MKPLFSILTTLVFFVFMACQEEDAPVLRGDIQGEASLVNCYGFAMSDHSGITVQLTGENSELETTTDLYGHYSFQDLPFGNYNIKFIKENYVQYDTSPVKHICGDASTIFDMTMNEVPAYTYDIDSITFYQNYYFNIYTHIAAATHTFYAFTNYYAYCFFSQSPNVSSENYEHKIIWTAIPWSGIFYSFWQETDRFLENYAGTVYCRIYAQTDFMDKWGSEENPDPPLRLETLGPPSEVYSFKVSDIIRTSPPSGFQF